MADINSKTPLQDSKDALQKESGNPIDFKMHDTVRGPNNIYTTVQTKGVEGTSSPVHGTELSKAIDEGQTNEDAEAAKNRAMKQGLAGV